MQAGSGGPPPWVKEGGAAPKMRMPSHPLTLDGAAVLHQMFRMRWTAWRALDSKLRQSVADEAVDALRAMERRQAGSSAAFSILGHKGDILFLHFRKGLTELSRAERSLSALRLSEFLVPTTSYVSVVELGLYESSVKLYQDLLDEGVAPGSDSWQTRSKARMDEQAAAMAPRLNPAMPPHKYLCFYPMDKKRGESRNWYSVPVKERRDMMREHGMIGRRFAGRVKQIISGSIGFDDWEWGVDLFADDPLVFKELIYEMRFDEASAVYALFGPFYISLRVPAAELGDWLDVVEGSPSWP